MREVKTYTYIYNEIARLIVIPVIFKTDSCMMKVQTLIDTGAAASYVSSFVSTSLNLQLTGIYITLNLEKKMQIGLLFLQI